MINVFCKIKSLKKKKKKKKKIIVIIINKNNVNYEEFEKIPS